MPVTFADVETLVRPRSVAVVGASDRVGSMGASTFANVYRHSSIDRVIPVNARAATVDGVPAAASVRDIEGGVDVAVVVVGARAVPGVMADCAASGTRNAIVLTSGFAELGEEGTALQRDVVDTARAGGVRVYGPNCPGLTNIGDNALLSMSPAAAESTRGGPVGLVTQGGGLGRSIMQTIQTRVGVNLWCSPGNESDLDVCDFINHMIDDPGITVIGAVIEGFRDGAKFIEVARRAMAAGKPIVMLKVGRSAYGERAAASHTAALAGNDVVVDAVFDQFGVVRADDIPDLCDTVSLFAQRRPKQSVSRVCVYSFSGGTASLAADLVGHHGLELATLAPATAAELRRIAPEYGLLDNPVDLTTEIFTNPDLNRAALTSITQDDAVDVVLLCVPADYGANTDVLCRDALDVVDASDKLLVPVWMSPDHGLGHRRLAEHDRLPFGSVTDAVRALARVHRWDGHAWQTAPPVEPPSVTIPGGDPAQLGERILEAAGIELPAGRMVRTAAEAVAAASELGHPVVMKISDPAIAHKSEHGGVRVGVRDEAEVRAAFADLWAIPSTRPDSDRAVQVQELVRADVELILGFHRDAVFGPVVSVGTGGIYAEYDGDVARFHPPVTPDLVLDGLRGLRVWSRLAGVRGRPPLSPEHVARVVAAFAALCADEANPLASLEINPLVPVPAGDGIRLVALDLLAEQPRGAHVLA
ncbi:acetate--CoA ligase family protein [Streptomyces sp. NPDC001984]